MTPRVSVGFLVYNDAPFVRRALDSILAQTHENLEVVVCDDCSTDGTGSICEEYAARDSRIRYIRHAKNVGISRNMEFALAQATGPYFMWAADDDVWAPTFVSSLLAALESKPDCVVAFSAYQLIDENDRPLERSGVRAVDYSGRDAVERIRKLARAWDDGFGYGLFRRADIESVRFPTWWGVNAVTAYNNIYPTLAFYLARGDFVLVDGEPLWFNRIKTSARVNHRLPYAGRGTRALLAAMLRVANVHAKCIEGVYRGSGSWGVSVRASAPLLGRAAGQLARMAVTGLRAI